MRISEIQVLYKEYLASGQSLKDFSESRGLSPLGISKLRALDKLRCDKAEVGAKIINEEGEPYSLAAAEPGLAPAIIDDIPIINKTYECAAKLIDEVDKRLKEEDNSPFQLKQLSSIVVEMMKLLREYHNSPTPYEALSMELAKKRVQIEETRLALEKQRLDKAGSAPNGTDLRIVFDVPEEFRQ